MAPPSCAKHPSSAASRCARCGKEFCAACEGEEPGPSCRACALQGAVAAADERSRDHDRAARAPLDADHDRGLRRRLLAETVIVAALTLLALAGRPASSRSTVHGAAGGPADGRGRRGYAECVESMWAIRAAIADAQWATHRPPASLLELPPAIAARRCPAEDRPYVYETGPRGAFYLACPDPAAHGVQALEAGPASLAPVVTP